MFVCVFAGSHVQESIFIRNANPKFMSQKLLTKTFITFCEVIVSRRPWLSPSSSRNRRLYRYKKKTLSETKLAIE